MEQYCNTVSIVELEQVLEHELDRVVVLVEAPDKTTKNEKIRKKEYYSKKNKMYRYLYRYLNGNLNGNLYYLNYNLLELFD